MSPSIDQSEKKAHVEKVEEQKESGRYRDPKAEPLNHEEQGAAASVSSEVKKAEEVPPAPAPEAPAQA